MTDKLYSAIQWLIVHSLKAVTPVMANDRLVTYQSDYKKTVVSVLFICQITKPHTF